MSNLVLELRQGEMMIVNGPFGSVPSLASS
jgi:hypothetical protein